MNILEAIVEFKLSRDWTKETAAFYEGRLARFAGWCEGYGASQLGDITAGVVRRYLAQLRETPNAKTGAPVKSQTLHGHMRAVRSLLRWAYTEELLTADIMRRVTMPTIEQEVVATFTPDEVQRLLKACTTPRDSAIIAVLVDTGLRRRELTGLEVGDVHIAAGDSYLTVRMGKGRKWREVGMGKRAALLLARYIHQHRPATDLPNLFIARGVKPLKPAGLHRLLLRVGQRAGITEKRLSAHGYRHTMATLSVEAGTDILRISHKLGHSRLATTQCYIKGLSSKSARTSPSVLDAL